MFFIHSIDKVSKWWMNKKLERRIGIEQKNKYKLMGMTIEGVWEEKTDKIDGVKIATLDPGRNRQIQYV